MTEYPERKHVRLREYDYSQNGGYFVTICTEGRAELFPFAVGAAPCGRPNVARIIAEKWLMKIPEKYPGVYVDKSVVMPNHIHLILRLDNTDLAGGHVGPPLHQILDWYKTMTTNEYIREVKAGRLPPFPKRVWQRGYYEHVIRNDQDYLDIWRYIDTNPAQWSQDEYFTR